MAEVAGIETPEWTREQIRQILRECVTVVKPGETLVVRVSGWTPGQVRQYGEWLEYAGERVGVRTLVVIGEELGVAECGDDGPG